MTVLDYILSDGALEVMAFIVPFFLALFLACGTLNFVSSVILSLVLVGFYRGFRSNGEIVANRGILELRNPERVLASRIKRGAIVGMVVGTAMATAVVLSGHA